MVESGTKLRLDRSQVEGLVRHALGSVRVTAVEELTDGYFSSAYRIDLEGHDAVVLKAAPPPGVPVLTYEQDLMRAEVEAMRLVAGVGGIPAPALRHVDLTRARLPVDYVVMDLVDGEPWSHVRQRLGPAGNDAVERQIGGISAAISEVTASGFGPLSSGPSFGTWFEAFAWMVAMLYSDARRFGIEPSVHESDLLRLLDRHRSAFDPVRVPRLVHWDLWGGNVLVTTESGGPTVSGVIDFERALWGDPLIEFIAGRFRDIEAFEAGFGRPLLRTHDERLRRLFYNAYLGLVLVVEDGPRQYVDRSTVEWGAGLLLRAAIMLEHGDIVEDLLEYA